MKKKTIIGLILIIVLSCTLFMNNNVYAYEFLFGNSDIMNAKESDYEKIFESYSLEAWAVSLKYVILHETAYATGTTNDPVLDGEKKVTEILTYLRKQGYFETHDTYLTAEQKATVDGMTNWGISNANDNFSFEGYIHAEADVDRNFYQAKYDERHDAPTVVEQLSLDSIASTANSFLDSANDGDKISPENMQTMSNSIYGILLAVGIILAVIMGLALAIKFITSGIEGKAETKQLLLPYGVGLVILFGAFTIWKIVLTILQS